MSAKVKMQKYMRREVRRTTDSLGRQMMDNALALSFWKRIRIALIIILKRPI